MENNNNNNNEFNYGQTPQYERAPLSQEAQMEQAAQPAEPVQEPVQPVEAAQPVEPVQEPVQQAQPVQEPVQSDFAYGQNTQQQYNAGAQEFNTQNTQQQYNAGQNYNQQQYNGGQNYNQQQYNANAQYGTIAPGHNKALASLILGIASFFCCGFVLGVIAIVMAVMAKNEGNDEGIRKAGFILGIIGAALWVVVVIASIVTGGTTYNYTTSI